MRHDTCIDRGGKKCPQDYEAASECRQPRCNSSLHEQDTDEAEQLSGDEERNGSKYPTVVQLPKARCNGAEQRC
jgi:hypothetical protein